MKKKVVIGVLIVVLVILVGSIIGMLCHWSEDGVDDMTILELTENQNEIQKEQDLLGEEETVQQELPAEENNFANASDGNTIEIWDAENTITTETKNDLVTQVTEELINIQLDTDNDGAEDYIEDYFGTDKIKEDTDGDGLSDFAELFALVLDPLKTDTDGNGVSDAQEDLEGDGLSNIFEFQIGTSIMHPDTDEDGLSDYDECKVYGTAPIMKDTDTDGVSDSRELEMGTDPLVPEETFYTIVKAESEDTVEVTVETTLLGTQVETLKVEKYENDFFFPTNMPGYIGGAYDFSVDGEISLATIRFKFDENLLEDANFEPVIYYFNEEKQELEELVTTIDGNVASVQVTHFSKYILLDRGLFKKAFVWKDVWKAYPKVSYAIIDDRSNSMALNDIYRQGITLADGIIAYIDALCVENNLEKECTRTIILFQPWSYHGELTMLYTSIYYACNDTLYGLGSGDKEVEEAFRIVFVLSDFALSDGEKYSDVVNHAKNNNIIIYTIGFGNNTSNFENYAIPLATETGGAFYLASDFLQLESIYDDIYQEIDADVDRDGDGISDYCEDNLIMFNGLSIELDKNNPDTDGDGLLDGEEVNEIYCEYNEDKTKVLVKAKYLSNPTNEDTDWDEISDAEERIIGTSPIHMDTDGDDMFDGFEYQYGYDPLTADNDGDGRSDYQEYLDGTDPYTYTKSWDEHVWDFICGFVLGDFIVETDSLPMVAGQVVSSFIPGVDIRDVVANIKNGDWGFAGLSALGLMPGGGDAAKAAGKVGKFVIKNIDEVPKVVGLMEFVNKNLPDVAKLLGKSDEFVDVAEQLAKSDNIKLTRSQRKVLTETIENAGLSQYLIKTSNSLDLKEPVEIGAEVWENGPCKRGRLIDEFVNGHKSGKALFEGESIGSNFPVFDRWIKDKKVLISTKSLDVAAQSYQNPTKLKNMLNKYADDINGFANRYANENGSVRWGSVKLDNVSDYKNVLEIILPDVVLNDNSLKVLNDFQNTMNESGIEVWYRIAQ